MRLDHVRIREVLELVAKHYPKAVGVKGKLNIEDDSPDMAVLFYLLERQFVASPNGATCGSVFDDDHKNSTSVTWVRVTAQGLDFLDSPGPPP